jgi:hypothetical protein
VTVLLAFTLLCRIIDCWKKQRIVGRKEKPISTLLLAFWACERPDATQLVVLVETDLDVPGDTVNRKISSRKQILLGMPQSKPL